MLCRDYSAIAWVDSGLVLSDGWSHRASRALDDYDVVQCFDHGEWLDQAGAVCRRKRGSIAAICEHDSAVRTIHDNTSVGGAWAARSDLFRDGFRLYDRAITGGGDSWVVSGLLGALDISAQVIKQACAAVHKFIVGRASSPPEKKKKQKKQKHSVVSDPLDALQPQHVAHRRYSDQAVLIAAGKMRSTSPRVARAKQVIDRSYQRHVVRKFT